MKVVAQDPAGNSVQSVEVGARALLALASCGPEASLSVLAAAAGMPPAKMHRYMQAWLATGFAEQAHSGGRYSLGPAAVALGLAALAGLDPAAVAARHLPNLRDATGQTAFFAVWGNAGPTVIQVSPAPGAVTVVTRVGAVLPVLGSATGLAFAAHLPASALDAAHAAPHRDGWAAHLAAVRAAGVATVRGLVLAGIDAAACPVLGPAGIEGVFTVLGPAGTIDFSEAGATLRALRHTAAACAHALGGPPVGKAAVK